MKKATLKLFNVHNEFKVKFTTFLSSDPMVKNGFNEPKEAISKYEFAGNEYMVIDPKSYVVIDITRKEFKDDYSSNNSFYLNRRALFSFILRLERLYRSFTQEKEMFYFDTNKDNELTINHSIADRHKETFVTCGQKTIQMAPCILDDNKNLYEGIYIAVNSLNYNAQITYDQLLYLIYELKKIDFSILEINLIVAYINYLNIPSKEIKHEPVKEEKAPEIEDTKKKIIFEDVSTIPDI